MEQLDFRVAVGDHIQFAKTVSESDVCMFTGITDDLTSGAPFARRQPVAA